MLQIEAIIKNSEMKYHDSTFILALRDDDLFQQQTVRKIYFPLIYVTSKLSFDNL